MDQYRKELDSPSWIAFVKITWLVAISVTGCGILYLPVDLWIKGFLGMGLLLCISSSFTVAKTLRDQHEAKKIIKQIDDAQTEQILKDHSRPGPVAV
ncbi:MAG: YiaA/YiaB family inner membrane protein [Verrucomicrobiales bacterium]|nr:YiaA/YiaB family inner membrane protein [Verrucomicrobiales bacterium]